MTLEEFAVERIKELECKKVELEAALKAKTDEYKAANSSIRKLREENESLKQAIGRNLSVHGTILNRGGNISVYISDSYKSEDSDLTEKEAQVRGDFDFLCKVIKEYRELHPEEFEKKKKDEEEEGMPF
jgi:hypothetical protein